MTLKALLDTINTGIHIRIFIGCQKVFDGIRAHITEKEWNRKMHDFMDCHVIDIRPNMNVVVICA